MSSNSEKTMMVAITVLLAVRVAVATVITLLVLTA